MRALVPSHGFQFCVAALAQSSSEGSTEEEDLFVARAALQLLAVGKANMLDEKLEDLQELLQSYESMVGRGLPDTPLLHFVNLLVKVPPVPAVPAQAVCTGTLVVFLVEAASEILWTQAVPVKPLRPPLLFPPPHP